MQPFDYYSRSKMEESALHVMREMFTYDNTKAFLLVDASNAFVAVNRQVALHNIQVVCSAISTILNNTYQTPIRLFILGEREINSSEGITQGDPLSMAMYALAIRPLRDRLRDVKPNVKQV